MKHLTNKKYIPTNVTAINSNNHPTHKFKQKEDNLNRAIEKVKAKLLFYDQQSAKIKGFSDQDRLFFRDWNNWHDLEDRLNNRLWENWSEWKEWHWNKFAFNYYP